jgi:hypothetical protein
MLEIIRQARVTTHIITKEKEIILKIVVGDKYSHEFPAKSRESKLCLTTDKGTIDALFDKGTYVFYGDKLVDYRRADSFSFIHNDESIKELSERIGIHHYEEKSYSNAVNGLFNQSRGSKNNGVFLGGEFSTFEMDIPELFEGGAFNNSLIYKWSPFSNTITTSLEVQRLVCTNGMVANAPFVTYEVPVVNDWEQSLKVISTRLETQINNVLGERFKGMANANSRSSVADLNRAHELLSTRFERSHMSMEDAKKLSRLIDLVDPSKHLSDTYDLKVLENSKLCKIADSHLTQFDLFNVLTEASTHYGRDSENDLNIQNQLNKIVFDDFKRGKKLSAKVPELGNSDHRRAFFGDSE